MFSYLFSRLWKNPMSRIGFLLAVTVILFALIFSIRNPLYKFLSRTFSSADWSDISTHGSRPYAFEENESKARDLTESAWREIYELAHAKLYKSHDSKEPIKTIIQTKPYSNFLTKEAESELFTFFNALADNCGSRITSISIGDKQTALGDLAQAQTARTRLGHDLRSTLKQLLKIQVLRAEAALQKKPDFLPAIELSQEIFRAACSIREIPSLLARALDYREYALQKIIFSSDNGRLYEKNAELFFVKSGEAYAKDKEYRELIRRYFENTRFRTAYEPAHLKNMRDSYQAMQNPQTLQSLIAALQAEARNSNPATAKKCHAELFSLDFPGVTDRSEYLYALAETAVLGEEYIRAENIIANSLKSGKIKDESLQKDFERLKFNLNLMRHESENISRF